MFVPIKFGGMDAVLHEHEADVVDIEVGFLLELPAQGVLGRLAEANLASGNAPEIGPFARANHERAIPGVEDDGADGGDGYGMEWNGR